jgi:hypothetical protein
VVAAVVIAAGMTACSSAKSDSAPTKLSPAAASPVAAPSPSLTPEAQVEAAVRTYYEAVNAAVATGDTNRMIALTAPGCGCRKLVGTVNSAFANGRSQGAVFALKSLNVQDVQGNTSSANVTYSVSAYQDLDSRGNVVESYEPYDGHDLLYMVKPNGQWIVRDVVHVNAASR